MLRYVINDQWSVISDDGAFKRLLSKPNWWDERESECWILFRWTMFVFHFAQFFLCYCNYDYFYYKREPNSSFAKWNPFIVWATFIKSNLRCTSCEVRSTIRNTQYYIRTIVKWQTKREHEMKTIKFKHRNLFCQTKEKNQKPQSRIGE